MLHRIAPALLAITLGFSAADLTAQGPSSIPIHGKSTISYTSRTIDPMTGLVHISGNVDGYHSLVGGIVGVDSYVLDPATGMLTGGGIRRTRDGSTYSVSFVGQFISPTVSVGTFTTMPGTGRFANMTSSGTWSSNVWASGLGSTVTTEGTSTPPR